MDSSVVYFNAHKGVKIFMRVITPDFLFITQNAHSEDVLRTLSELLSSEDNETGWFSAM